MERDTQQSAEALLALVQGVMRELHPHRTDGPPPTLDSQLEAELGFDSLGRVELLLRAERAFGVSLPDQVLNTAETPRDLVRLVLSAHGAPSARSD